VGKNQGGATRFEIILPEPGIWEIRVAEGEGDLSASSNPILCGKGGLFKPVFWGDIHGHTSLSDGTGHVDDYYRYARDAALLDVAAITDHAALGLRPLAGKPWATILDSARDYYEPGRFVTFVAYEWTNWVYGHRNVYFPGANGEVFSAIDPGTETPEGLWETLREWRIITIPHHVGGGPIAMDWDHDPPPGMEPVVELFSVHGNSEYYGCPGMIYSPMEGHFVQDALSRGLRLAFLASGDGHIGHPGRWRPGYREGLVAFQAEALTREAIWSSLTSRRVYGTTGARILLEFSLNGSPMGSEIPDEQINDPRRGQIYAMGTRPLVSVEVIRNGSVFRDFACNGLLETFQFIDSGEAERDDYYYVRVTQEDGHQAWSSPIWLGLGFARN